MRSHTIGLRLNGIAELPTCDFPNGSATSPNSGLLKMRMSAANFESDAPRPASPESNR